MKHFNVGFCRLVFFILSWIYGSGTNALFLANFRVLGVKKQALVSFMTRFCVQVKQYVVFKLFWNSDYEISLDYLAYNRAREVIGFTSNRCSTCMTLIFGKWTVV